MLPAKITPGGILLTIRIIPTDWIFLFCLFFFFTLHFSLQCCIVFSGGIDGCCLVIWLSLYRYYTSLLFAIQPIPVLFEVDFLFQRTSELRSVLSSSTCSQIDTVTIASSCSVGPHWAMATRIQLQRKHIEINEPHMTSNDSLHVNTHTNSRWGSIANDAVAVSSRYMDQYESMTS